MLVWKLWNWQSLSSGWSICGGSRWALPGLCTTLRSPAFACAYGLPAAGATVQRPLARGLRVDVCCRACSPLAVVCCFAAQVSVDGTTVTTPGKNDLHVLLVHMVLALCGPRVREKSPCTGEGRGHGSHGGGMGDDLRPLLSGSPTSDTVHDGMPQLTFSSFLARCARTKRACLGRRYGCHSVHG